MPFAAKSAACAKNGNVKKGFKMITDKNGKERYMTDGPSKVVKSDVKKKDVKPVLKKVKKEIVEKKEVKTKGSTPEPKKVIKKVVKKKKEDVKAEDDEEKLKLDFE